MIENNFKYSMSQAGLSTKDKIIADGKLHRFRVDGDKAGSKNGWYILYGDGVPAGSFGSWKIGDKGTWCAKSSRDLTQAEREENKRRIDAARKTREEDELNRRNLAQQKACSIWGGASMAPADHPYLVKKQVKAHGARLHKGLLTIPILDVGLNIHSLQFIDGSGNKRFLSGGRKKGFFFPIGTEQPMDSLYICEGFATGASLYGLTNCFTAIAFDAGNLLHVAKALRASYPIADITICADNDADKPVNTGVIKAREAALAVNAYVAKPVQTGDFNDAITGART